MAARRSVSSAAWQRVIGTNLFGVVNGVRRCFGPAMVAAGRPGLIINTGSKQGITTPPGDTAYNVSKAGVKVLTEALQHELRSIEGGQVEAKLLIPGFVWTGLTTGDRAEKPDGALDARRDHRLHAGLDRARRFLHPLPRQRGRPSPPTRSASSGPPATSSRTGRRCRAGTRTMAMPSRPS